MTSLTIALTLGTALLSAPAEPLSAENEYAFNIRLSPDSDQVAWDALAEGERTVRLAFFSKFRPLRPKVPSPARDAVILARRKVLVSHHDGERWKLDFGGKEPASPSAASDIHPELSPDGKWLAFVSGRSGKGDLYVTPAGKTNQSPRRVAGTPWPDVHPAWSPDSNQLAVVSATDRGRTLTVFKGISAGGTIAEVPIADERINPLQASWRPDGKEVAFFGRNWSSATILYVATPGVGAPVQRMVRVRPQARGPVWHQQGDKWYLLAVRSDDAVVAVDPLGGVTVLDTGTFGHGELALGQFKGKTWLVFTAQGLKGAEAESLEYSRLFRWEMPALE